MSVTVEPKAFHQALSRATSAITRMKTIPILLCVRISAEDGQMMIEATDLDVSISIQLPAEGECSPVCIEYDRLLGIVASVKDRPELRIDPLADTATIVAGRSRFTVATLTADAWPVLTEQAWQHSFDVEGPAFARLMTALQPAISSEKTRFYLNGIHLSAGSVVGDGVAGSLLGVATDGHKLYARSIAVPGVVSAMPGFILPTSACIAIAKLFGESKVLHISCNDRKLRVIVDGVHYITKLVEGQFPDWRRVTPKTESTCAYDLQELVASAKVVAAAKISEKSGKAIKLTFRDDETELLASDTKNPSFSGVDTVRHTMLMQPAEAEIGLNVDYLITMLEHLDAETVELATKTSGDPIVIRGATFKDRVMVIMPMRV